MFNIRFLNNGLHFTKFGKMEIILISQVAYDREMFFFVVTNNKLLPRCHTCSNTIVGLWLDQSLKHTIPYPHTHILHSHTHAIKHADDRRV